MTSRRNYGLMGITGLAVVAVASVGLLVAAPRHGKPKKGKDKSHPTLKIGAKAPDFTLKDTQGKEHKLSDYTKEGKIVVLEWFNPGCPFIKSHHGKQHTMAHLYKEFKDKNVVFMAINSTNPDHPDYGKDAEAKKQWKIEYPILSDADGKVGHAYGAKTTPHMFVINKDGKLAYTGAMDNDPRNRKTEDAKKPENRKINYVRAALDELVAGKKVTKSTTRPYGCGVKYKK